MAFWGLAYSHGPNYNFHADVGYYAFSITPDVAYPSQSKAIAALDRASQLIQASAAHAAPAATGAPAKAAPEQDQERAPYKYTPVEVALAEAQRIRFGTYPWPVEDNSVTPFLPRICSRTLMGCVGLLLPATSRRGRLLPAAFAHGRSSDDVIAFEGRPRHTPILELRTRTS